MIAVIELDTCSREELVKIVKTQRIDLRTAIAKETKLVNANVSLRNRLCRFQQTLEKLLRADL